MKYTVSLIALLLLSAGQPSPKTPAQTAPSRTTGAAFNVFEASIADMQAAMKSGKTTSHEIVQ